MSLDFVAIDFETANMFRGSPCSVGLVKVEGGEIADSRSMLLKPVPPDWDPEDEPLEDLFDSFNVMLHGITAEAVKDAPAFYEAWPEVLAYVGGLPLVAHNAAFDTGVIRDALDEALMPWPSLSYACTLVMGRRTYELVSYRLPFVAEAAGLHFSEEEHHDACYDAEVAARVMLDIALRNESDDLLELTGKLGIRLGEITPDSWNGCTRRSQSKPGRGLTATDVEINANADPSGTFFGRGVTFTGALASMTRALAWQRVAELGGVPLDSVSKKTNFLVFGHQDARMLRPGAERSAKFDKALKLRDKGADIEIIAEDDFLRMLTDTSTSGRRAGLRGFWDARQDAKSVAPGP